MRNKFNYFKNERTILSITIDLEDKSFISSNELVIFIQAQIKDVYHVVLERALYDNILYSTNLVIFYTLEDNKDCFLLTCQNYTLTKHSRNNLLLNYYKFIKSERIILYYGLQP
jgi:hypothetical protein